MLNHAVLQKLPDIPEVLTASKLILKNQFSFIIIISEKNILHFA
jgi:hypothetical protein